MGRFNFKDEEMEGATKGREFRRIVSYFENKRFLFLSLFVSGIMGASNLMNLLIMKDATAMFNINSNQGLLDAIATVLKKAAWITAIIVVINVSSATLQSSISPTFMVDIRKRLYRSLMNADISFFDKISTGAMITRISEGVAYIKDVYVDMLFITISMVVNSFSGLIVGLCYGWKYTLTFIAFPIGLGLELWAGNKWANYVDEKYSAAGTESNEKAVAVITEFRTVKSFDQENDEIIDFKNDLKKERGILVQVGLIRGATAGIATCILIAMMLVVCWYMMKENFAHKIDPDPSESMYKMSCIMFGVIMLTIGIFSALSISDDFNNAKSAARNICAIIDLKPEIDPDVGREMPEVKGNIEFKDVSFRYKGCEQYALRHLSLAIEAGQTVAFVGESGCGKSTTLQLLQRFYDVEEGQILIDGTDIREVTPRSLRKNISIVPQSPVLFTMTIADNIAYGRPNATNDEISQAAVTGNAHNFIMELPSNYSTMVQQTSLSGGQKQRICISRAILSPTPILLLDEATAALDTESEQLVQQSLESFRKGKTSILVAHRLSTVLNADKIFVYNEGHIVESGTHKELLEQNGVYANLAKYQLQ